MECVGILTQRQKLPQPSAVSMSTQLCLFNKCFELFPNRLVDVECKTLVQSTQQIKDSDFQQNENQKKLKFKGVQSKTLVVFKSNTMDSQFNTFPIMFVTIRFNCLIVSESPLGGRHKQKNKKERLAPCLCIWSWK